MNNVSQTASKSEGNATVWTLLLLLVTFTWGNAFVAIKNIIEYVSPLELVAVRFIPVAIVFVALMAFRWREALKILRADGGRVALLGLTGGVLYNVFLAWGEVRVPAGTASLIVALNPAFTYVLSVLFLDETFTWQRTLGLAVAFAGLFVIVRWGSGQTITLTDAGYALITVLAPVCWAIYTVTGKGLVSRHPPFLVTGLAMTFAGLMSLVFVRPSLIAQLPDLPTSFWGSTLFLSLLCTVFAFAIWFGALEWMPAGRVASFVYLVPMFGVTFSSLLLDEPITWGLGIGALILIGGVLLVNRGG